MPKRIITVRLIKGKSEPRRSFLAGILAGIKIKDIASVITGFSTLLLSMVSFYYVYGLNSDKQKGAEIKAREDALKALETTNPAKAEGGDSATQPSVSSDKTEQKKNKKQADSISKDATSGESNKSEQRKNNADSTSQEAKPESLKDDSARRKVAAITLAAYGDTALPTIRILLGGSDKEGNMRDFGVNVVQSWMEAGDSKARGRMIAELLGYARSSSLSLRQGAYAALGKISPMLDQKEACQILFLIVERFGTGNSMLETDVGLANQASLLLDSKYFTYPQTRLALRNIANSDAVAQALNSYSIVLSTKEKLPQGSCPLLIADLAQLEVHETNPTIPQKLSALRENANTICGKTP